MRDCDMFSHERALTELENELGQDEDEELDRMEADMAGDKAAHGDP